MYVLLRTIPTTLFGILCEFVPDPLVIFQLIIGPDNTGTNISMHERDSIQVKYVSDTFQIETFIWKI